MNESLKYAVGVLAILLSFIPFGTLKGNVWKWLLKKIGETLFQTVNDRLDAMSKTISAIDARQVEQEKRLELSDVEDARRRVLRFADEERHEITHSEEHFGLINDDIQLYENYCGEHPKYKNMKATSAIALINKKYNEGNFLT